MCIRDRESMYERDFQEGRLQLDKIALYSFAPEEPFLPEEPFYIRCAGNNGRKCMDFLRTKGLEPVAFVETDESKIGTEIDSIKVISLESYLEKTEESQIVVALWDWLDVTAELIARGVSQERVSISWGDTGSAILHLSDLKGRKHRYFDASKWKRDILDRAEEMRCSMRNG